MTQNEDYVSPEQAAALKQAGFDWPTQAYYSSDSAPEGQKWLEVGVHTVNHNSRHDLTSAPTLAQAQKWLREKNGCEVVVDPLYSNNKSVGYDWYVYDDCSGFCALRATLPFACTYEAALSAGITAALKLITQKIKMS